MKFSHTWCPTRLRTHLLIYILFLCYICYKHGKEGRNNESHTYQISIKCFTKPAPERKGLETPCSSVRFSSSKAPADLCMKEAGIMLLVTSPHTQTCSCISFIIIKFMICSKPYRDAFKENRWKSCLWHTILLVTPTHYHTNQWTPSFVAVKHTDICKLTVIVLRKWVGKMSLPLIKQSHTQVSVPSQSCAAHHITANWSAPFLSNPWNFLSSSIFPFFCGSDFGWMGQSFPSLGSDKLRQDRSNPTVTTWHHERHLILNPKSHQMPNLIVKYENSNVTEQRNWWTYWDIWNFIV